MVGGGPWDATAGGRKLATESVHDGGRYEGGMAGTCAAPSALTHPTAGDGNHLRRLWAAGPVAHPAEHAPAIAGADGRSEEPSARITLPTRHPRHHRRHFPCSSKSRGWSGNNMNARPPLRRSARTAGPSRRRGDRGTSGFSSVSAAALSTATSVSTSPAHGRWTRRSTTGQRSTWRR